MDSMRKVEEKRGRLRLAEAPFIETYRDFVLQEQPLGAPVEREIIVVRIDKSYLKLYSCLLALVVFTVVAGILLGKSS